MPRKKKEVSEVEEKKPRYSVKRRILNRDKATYNTSGLSPKTAPDTHGGTVHIQGKVEPEDKEFLASLPEGVSYHLRQAIRAYVDRLKSGE